MKAITVINNAQAAVVGAKENLIMLRDLVDGETKDAIERALPAFDPLLKELSSTEAAIEKQFETH